MRLWGRLAESLVVWKIGGKLRRECVLEGQKKEKICYIAGDTRQRRTAKKEPKTKINNQKE